MGQFITFEFLVAVIQEVPNAPHIVITEESW